MNADLKRVRDSSLDGPSSSKRRALSSGASSPVNTTGGDDSGDADGLEEWMRVVESKRKEAIYRQMLEYRRSNARESARADALEQQCRAHERVLKSFEACWAQLVNAVRDRAGRADKPEPELLDFSVDPSQPQVEIDSGLQTRMSATLRLVSGFADAAAGRAPSLPTDLQQQVVRLQAEASSLRATSSQLEAKVEELRASRDANLRDLQRAEKRLDRQRMDFDKERGEWLRSRDEQVESPAAKPVANGSGHSTPNAAAARAQDTKEGTAPASPSVDSERVEELERITQKRDEQLKALRLEHVATVQELDRLKVLAHHPSEAALRESPFFQVYLQQLATQTSRADVLQARFEASEQKLDQLRDANLEFRDAVLVEARTEAEALRQQVGKKDTDLARLRGQRDEMNAELTERRQREADRMRFADEMEGLCKARQERITLLASEVRRLKGKLAAQHGAEGYLAFLRGDGGIDGDYVRDLEERGKAANNKIAALSEQLEKLAEGGAAAAAAESEFRVELEVARRSLAKYERVLGPNADPSVADLTQRLQDETDGKTQLELRLSEAEASTDALYAEVEGISKQWEALEHTLRTKVFELKDAELRMGRLQTEKAKADNKFYQAMRSKEAIEAECKTAQRSVDKQLKLLERAQEVERALTAQLAQQEKGLTSLKNSGLDLQTQLATVSAEKTQLELRLQRSQTALAEAQATAHTRVAEATADRAALTKAQDELAAAERTLAKMKAKQEALMSAAAGSGASAQEVQIREEREKLLKLLRCSCCERNLKQQVIVKCMHTFCKECLDSRIASRQRKCPACGLAFAKEDIQTLYWQ